VFAGFTVLSLGLFSRAWRSPTTVNIGTNGDPPLFMWFLRWTPYALRHHLDPFVTHRLNYPSGVNLMWNTFVFLPGVVLSPVTVLFGPIAAFNTLMTLNVALSSLAASFAAYRFVQRRVTALLAGLVYGFGPYMMAQSHEHAHLTSAYIVPLVLVLLDEILCRQRYPPMRTGLVLGLLAAAQLLIAEELLASEAVAAVVGLVVLVALHPRGVLRRARYAATALLSAFCVFAYVAALPLWIQAFGPQRIHGTIFVPNFFVTDVANFIVPTRTMLFAPRAAVAMTASWTASLAEWDGYLGVPLLVLLAAATISLRRNQNVRVLIVTGAILALLSMGPHLHVNGHDTGVLLPWRIVDHLPVLQNMLPARLMLYVDLLTAIVLSIFVDRVVMRLPSPTAIVAIVLVALAIASFIPRVPFPTTRLARTQFFTGSAVDLVPRNSVALVAPFQQLTPSEPMLWQAEANMRYAMPQGYFIGPDPSDKPMFGAQFSSLSSTMEHIQGGAAVELSADLMDAVRRDLLSRKVDTVLVGPVGHEPAMLEFFAQVLRSPPLRVDDVFVWLHVLTQLSTMFPRLGL
jgi:hypothetical protein